MTPQQSGEVACNDASSPCCDIMDGDNVWQVACNNLQCETIPEAKSRDPTCIKKGGVCTESADCCQESDDPYVDPITCNKAYNPTTQMYAENGRCESK